MVRAYQSFTSQHSMFSPVLATKSLMRSSLVAYYTNYQNFKALKLYTRFCLWKEERVSSKEHKCNIPARWDSIASSPQQAYGWDEVTHWGMHVATLCSVNTTFLPSCNTGCYKFKQVAISIWFCLVCKGRSEDWHCELKTSNGSSECGQTSLSLICI